MKIINPGFKILTKIDGVSILKAIEAAGRTCYKSERKISNESAPKFVKGLIALGHLSVLEHQSITVRIVCDRGVSHELVRHRLASYSQESTRYCNYKSGISYINPHVSGFSFMAWLEAMETAEDSYNTMIENGVKPEIARSVLPHSLATEVVVTMNLRQWRHFFQMRAIGVAGKPHPQMLEITIPMLKAFKRKIPIIFDDLEVV